MTAEPRHDTGTATPTEASAASDQAPRLMFVVHRLAHGGAEQQVAALAGRFAARGYAVAVVVAGRIEDDDLARQLSAAGVRVFELRAWGLRQTVTRLTRTIRGWKPDLIHSHGFRPNIAARLARAFAPRASLINTTHNLGEGQFPFNTRRWELRYRLTDPMATLTTNVCGEGLRRYIEAGAIPKAKAAVVPNGIDTSRFAPDPNARARIRQDLGLAGRFAFIAVGRIAAGKGYENILDAFAALDPQPDSILLIVGSGPDEDEIRDRARATGLGDRIRFLGPRDDIPELLNAADGYVMGSWSEALPLVLLEASAAGLPLIATDVGGNRDVIVDGETGWLVPARDTEALRTAMHQLVTMPDADRRAMGDAGRRRTIEAFSLDEIVDRWSAIYARHIRQRRRRPGQRRSR